MCFLFSVDIRSFTYYKAGPVDNAPPSDAMGLREMPKTSHFKQNPGPWQITQIILTRNRRNGVALGAKAR